MENYDMANEEIRETVVTKLARLEEIIKSGFAINEKAHNDIRSDITALIGDIQTDITVLNNRFNTKIEKAEDRIHKCEEYQKRCEDQKTGQINIYKIITAILTFIISGAAVLKIFGVF